MTVVEVQDVVEIGVSCIGIQCISAGPEDVGVVQAHTVARSGAPILARAVVPGLVVTLFHCGTGTSVQYFSAASQYAAFLVSLATKFVSTPGSSLSLAAVISAPPATTEKPPGVNLPQRGLYL